MLPVRKGKVGVTRNSQVANSCSEFSSDILVSTLPFLVVLSHSVSARDAC